jgi:U3 small nucleolar RNA-associated protein 20
MVCYIRVQGVSCTTQEWMSSYHPQQSVSQTMHTAAPLIITPLINYHLTCEKTGPTYNLLRRVLTALIHHCKSADQFAPVADLVITRLSEVVNEHSQAMESDDCALERIVNVVAVMCAVRQGSRMSRASLQLLLFLRMAYMTL